MCIYVCVLFPESVTITPKDARWVGAWWLGFFVSAVIMLLSGIPFWFLPRSLPKQGELPANPYVLPETPDPNTEANGAKITALAKGNFLSCFLQYGKSHDQC